MSQQTYHNGMIIAANHEFQSVVEAAMRLADSENILKLKAAFPEIYAELAARYYAPGGRLPNEDATFQTKPQLTREAR